MDKIELKHLAAYLPYNLQIQASNGDKWTLTSKNLDFALRWKPILRPMSESELTKVFPTSMGDCSVLGYISTSIKDSQLNARMLLSGKADQIEQWKFERLLEQQFDVFGLIPAGLAVDINTLR